MTPVRAVPTLLIALDISPVVEVALTPIVSISTTIQEQSNSRKSFFFFIVIVLSPFNEILEYLNDYKNRSQTEDKSTGKNYVIIGSITERYTDDLFNHFNHCLTHFNTV